ncbi:hypothetical protein FOB44_13935 [Chryseobacterium gallinarum]|uniref:TonB C-terminal domain-containing protein n=2 Tax=Chryseobacterium gallinarum TaxID=1324352 RepID=A0ABX6KT13_CHRGL|nr:hypothetical protein FOB44_13935 [Chryseobacterium gallinarum]
MEGNINKYMMIGMLLLITFSVKAQQQASAINQHTKQTPASNPKSGSGNNGPQFPGGMAAFKKEFVRNFRSRVLHNSGIKEASAIATFIIEKDGSMSNIKIESTDNEIIQDEFIRALKKIKTQWIPGEQNGTKIRVKARQPLIFTTGK